MRGRPCQLRRGASGTINENLDARAAVRQGFLERSGSPPVERGEHTLDVLAGSEAVHAMIDASAGIAWRVQTADLHLIGVSAAGLRTESAEERVLGLQRLDRYDVGAAPPTPERNLVLVSGAPALHDRAIEDGTCLARVPASTLRVCRPQRPPVLRITKLQHEATLGGDAFASITALPAPMQVSTGQPSCPEYARRFPLKRPGLACQERETRCHAASPNCAEPRRCAFANPGPWLGKLGRPRQIPPVS